MKAKRRIFIGLGWFFLVFQILGYLGSINDPEVIQSASLPFMLGYNFLLMLAIVFFVRANRLKRKIKRKADRQQIDSFLVDSNNT